MHISRESPTNGNIMAIKNLVRWIVLPFSGLTGKSNLKSTKNLSVWLATMSPSEMSLMNGCQQKGGMKTLGYRIQTKTQMLDTSGSFLINIPVWTSLLERLANV